MTGGMGATDRFRRWAAWTGESQQAIAARLGCHQSLVSRVLGGNRTAGLQFALAVERETAAWPEGPVIAAEWGREQTINDHAPTPAQGAAPEKAGAAE